ncbi:MAG: AlpA family phage regulatory protein [Acidobacteria bacterium]|nr:AlpA family phage regulatory protein [Acidobacteriota bacterium]
MNELASAATRPPSLQLLRPRNLATALGVSTTTLWRWAKAPDFPRPFRLGENSIAFDAQEIARWLAGRRR